MQTWKRSNQASTLAELSNRQLLRMAQDHARAMGTTPEQAMSEMLRTNPEARSAYETMTGPHASLNARQLRERIAATKQLQKRAQAGELASQIVEKRAEELWKLGKYPTTEQARATCWTNDLYQQHRRETE